MEYIDLHLVEYIEREDVQAELRRWVELWEQALRDRHLLGSLSNKFKVEVVVLNSQIILRSAKPDPHSQLEGEDQYFQFRLRTDHRDPEKAASLSPIPPEEWIESSEQEEIWN